MYTHSRLTSSSPFSEMLRAADDLLSVKGSLETAFAHKLTFRFAYMYYLYVYIYVCMYVYTQSPHVLHTLLWNAAHSRRLAVGQGVVGDGVCASWRVAAVSAYQHGRTHGGDHKLWRRSGGGCRYTCICIYTNIYVYIYTQIYARGCSFFCISRRPPPYK